MEFGNIVIIACACGACLFVAAVIVPWACKHDGEGIIKAIKNTIKQLKKEGTKNGKTDFHRNG